ncbi:hypothetical protein ACMFMF_006156 [Clarireedia jacksonii]
MGNCCSNSSDPTDPFSQPGRTLSSSAPTPPSNQKTTSSVPKKVGGPPRTLGGSSPSSDEASDARRKAAEAAEVLSPFSYPFCIPHSQASPLRKCPSPSYAQPFPLPPTHTSKQTS